jgi:hypothetical protein
MNPVIGLDISKEESHGQACPEINHFPAVIGLSLRTLPQLFSLSDSSRMASVASI